MAASETGPILLDGYDTGKSGNNYIGRPLSQTVQAVGNFTVKYTSTVLGTLKANDSNYAAITVDNNNNGSIFLTGFKLESMIVSAEQQIDNAKVVPLVNGDSITLVNVCKAGVLSFNASRTAGGIQGGDCVAVFDYVRSQGDVGGRLQISWVMNGKQRSVIFAGVCIKQCPPLALAGNDVPDYNIQLTYSNYTDSDSPAYNELLGM